VGKNLFVGAAWFVIILSNAILQGHGSKNLLKFYLASDQINIQVWMHVHVCGQQNKLNTFIHQGHKKLIKSNSNVY